MACVLAQGQHLRGQTSFLSFALCLLHLGLAVSSSDWLDMSI